MSWYEQIEPNVLTYVKYSVEELGYRPRFTSVLDKTVVDDNGVPKKLPTVYIHMLQPAEVGNDLDNTEINGVLATIEIQIFSNNYNESQSLRTITLDCMKKLRFNVPMLPVTTNQGDYFLTIARYRRVIGGGDSDLITEL